VLVVFHGHPFWATKRRGRAQLESRRRIRADGIVDLCKKDGATTNAEHWAPLGHENVRRLQKQHQQKLLMNCSLLYGKWNVLLLLEFGLQFMNFQFIPLAACNMWNEK
jgi:hypothetical protein